MKLNEDFYQRSNVVTIARELIGKQLFTNISGIVTGGVIVETEAYSWKEKGCHAYAQKRTPRNEVMFATGGFAYVYLCYGMYHLVNVVTNKKDKAEAVLIRAIEPTVGIQSMTVRRKGKTGRHLTSGPGKLTEALGITRMQNGKWLMNDDIWIEEGRAIKRTDIVATKRIGIDYAAEDADLLWRFYLRDNIWVSKK
jgi:DNA-3-methyladenine glycosylase